MYQLYGIIDINAIDHNSVYAVDKQPKIEKTYKFIWARSYCNFNYLLFERDIIFADWANVTEKIEPNLAWDNFADKLVEIVDVHAPYKNESVWLYAQKGWLENTS